MCYMEGNFSPLELTATSFWRGEGHLYIGCPRRSLQDFSRVFLMLKYADINQNIYVLSWTVTEKSVVFWRVNALCLSADKSYRTFSLSLVSDDGSH
jgi:hypothetical protein